MTTTSIDEPVPAPDQAPGAGSTSSAPRVSGGRDFLRALACALLVAASVSSPGSAPLFAPFVPALVAIRLLRQRAGARAFLATTSVGSLLAALGAGADRGAWVVAAAAALLLVPALGSIHARAARHDPIERAEILEWPEPHLRTGLTPVIGAWVVALLLVAALAAPLVPSLADTGADLVRDGYSLYTRECEPDGSLAERKDFCEQTLEQRDQAIDIVRDHAAEVLAAFLAVFAFGAAATAHPVVLARARRHSDRVRRSWRLRELELHWSFAYVLAAGLVAFMAAGDGSGTSSTSLRAVGIGFATLGGLAMVSQGIGLVAWVFGRGGAPTWYRVALGVFALFVLPVTIAVVFSLGVLDLALHPRRRAAARANR